MEESVHFFCESGDLFVGFDEFLFKQNRNRRFVGIFSFVDGRCSYNHRLAEFLFSTIYIISIKLELNILQTYFDKFLSKSPFA